MSAFGDIEPEDSWDPDDPVAELIENVRRRVELLGEAIARFDDAMPLDERVERLHDRLERVQCRANLTERDRLRISDSIEDLATISELLG